MSATYASFYNALVEKKKGAEPIVIEEDGKDE
jgi:hypothetical protein